MTGMTLTSCQTYSVRLTSVLLCSSSVVPCRSRSAHQTSAEWCLKVATLLRPSNVSWGSRRGGGGG